MKRAVLILGGVGLLALAAGCQTKSVNEMSYTEVKEYAGKLHERCVKQGAKEGADMQMCINQEARSDEAKRIKNKEMAQAIGQALSDTGDQMQANARNQALVNAMNRPVNCTSRRSYAGGPVYTSCY